MNKRERYKRLILFVTSALILSVQTLIFMDIWFNDYSNIGSNYFERGNYFIIAQYALMLFLFYKIYGGLKVGHLRISGMMYSQFLSIICVNMITYLQLCLIGRWKLMTNFEPIIRMTLVDFIVSTIWIIFSRFIYVKIFPPKKMLVIYGDYNPDNLIQKLSSREDKYFIDNYLMTDITLKDTVFFLECSIINCAPLLSGLPWKPISIIDLSA